jgi:cyclohexa-1,5-dienecarbonyl-CoA hydratase
MTNLETSKRPNVQTSKEGGSGPSIRVRVSDGVATIVLDRPPLNVLNIAMLEEIGGELQLLVDDPAVAAIVFRAAGGSKAFSAGVDVGDHTAERVGSMIETFHRVFRLLAATDAVTIAAVNGAALGGACELACYCDIVLASERAKFGQPEVKVGVFPPVAASILPWRVGFGRAVEINALGETIKADEAKAIGLATHVYPAEEFKASVDAYLASIAKLSRPVVRLAKRATINPFRKGLLAHLEEAERLYLDELMNLKDAHEGLAAFLEKREPKWVHA